MTPLARLLTAQIAQTGPVRIADFMATCLTHPEHGYYTTRDPLGATGDFITAPEISQMFGEMVGLWLAQAWMTDGAPRQFTLAELGPGRGTLMADILRATRGVPGFHDAMNLWLIEASPHLRRSQAETLEGFTPRWTDTAADLPKDCPLYAVANEFFDALAIRQYLREGDRWRERVVGLDAGHLAFGLAPGVHSPELDRRFGKAADGTWVEISPAGEAVTAELASTAAARGGAILAIDYGEWDGTGDTLQGMADHAYRDVLDTPGDADLTAQVGFRWLADAAAPLQAHFTTQGRFLEHLGITPRAQALARGAQDPDQIARQHRRLTHPDEMGSLFKVLALRPAGSTRPPGFES